MPEATDWDIWHAGLIEGPEPRGRRTKRELAEMAAQHQRNFAEACFAANQRWDAQYGPRKEPYRSAAHYRAEELLCERLGIGSF